MADCQAHGGLRCCLLKRINGIPEDSGVGCFSHGYTRFLWIRSRLLYLQQLLQVLVFNAISLLYIFSF